ncbi:lysylphosphatidylglycerol synthase transmembrane domain-containing protein [Chitinophaga sp. HK235]|uniref:lysylphosphatidylglycerol synthase transmembrane domain-containing protein n=1 Tax=Chitinophaga sp. HK235 TaxID=2952571 RepID=UPI0020126ECD|nr:lysylphosphatidylglycerol synthase transmembrane domain-containing protein [Chitinophaga sp. HK235]
MPVTSNDKTPSSREKIKTSYWVWSVVFFVFALVLIIFYYHDIKKELLLLKRVDIYWLAIAICSQLLTYFFAAIVYRVLLKAYKLERYPDLWELMKATVISLFFNQAIPSGGISGSTFIFGFLESYKVSPTDLISLIVVELMCYYFALEILIILLLLAAIFVYKTPQVFIGTLAAGILIFIFLGFIIVFAGRKKFLAKLFEKMKRIKFIGKNMSLDISQSRGEGSLSFLKKERIKVMKGTLFQLLMIAADCLTIYALLRGMGTSPSPYVVVLTFIGTRIIAVLPLSPGSLVVFESSMVFFLTHLGVPVGTAIVVTLLYRLLSFWFPMPVGFMLYRSELKKKDIGIP